MTHRQAYESAAKLARKHRKMCDILANIELKKYGFEFAETDSDPIIDTINYGINNCTFEEYKKEMERRKINRNQNPLKWKKR